MIDTSSLKEKIEANLSQIITDLRTIAILEPETGDWVVAPDTDGLRETDENSEADSFEETEERRATLAELETSYRDGMRALAKIAGGTFGVCEICNASVEEDRLAFLPTARTCKAHLDDERTLTL
jgi:RNA polymerase-binding transcription factor DksA